MKIVDTHQHLWDLEQFPYSWCAGIPKLNRSFRLPDYHEASHGADIVKTVFMECDVDEPHQLDEARHIQKLADSNPLIAGIIASCRPGRLGFRRHLEELSQLPKVRGLRRVLHTQPDDLSQNSLFSDNLNLLPEFGFTFDLCLLARQLPVGMELVKRCPQVTFILDHCGVPDVKGRAFDPWREHIRQFAALPNVNCKISGLVAYADPENWTVDDLRPWVEHVLECFGWDRVVWGSDWPVCTLSANLKQWVDAALEITANAATADREKLFQKNAERIYRV
jgi:predicted TIM-barrel fold metal-dependent hydrolase